MKNREQVSWKILWRITHEENIVWTEYLRTKMPDATSIYKSLFDANSMINTFEDITEMAEDTYEE